MPDPNRERRPYRLRRTPLPLVLAAGVVFAGGAVAAPPLEPRSGPFPGFDLPADWQSQFWASPNARALLRLDPDKLVALVPVQAGVRFCRCPKCEADEAEDPLRWSVERPRQLTCARCGATVPEDPAKSGLDDKEKKPAPEEPVEVRPGVVHHYPYVEVPEASQRYPGERLYVAAKADYEAREFLSKAAMYAAVRSRDPAAAREAASYSRTACLLLLRFAQVYPDYATHLDQPRSEKFFQAADLAPPFRQGYGTAKWDWSGSLDVPLNLVVAYAIVRDDPALAEAGRRLRVANPAEVIERQLFRNSAAFVARQPEEVTEAGLQAVRGLLAVGRLLNDPALLGEGRARLNRIVERGFYHDGLWRQGSMAAHARVLALLDGWIARLLADPPSGPGPLGGSSSLPFLSLARTAGTAFLTGAAMPDEVVRTSWPAPSGASPSAGPALLGGAGVARLHAGRGPGSLDLELRSLDAFGPERLQRQAFRLAVGGQTVLDDLDAAPPLADGFQHASASHNTVLIDGLNHRESLDRAREPAPGGNFLFFAADPDFQVVTLDDTRAYPNSATRYRQTLLLSEIGSLPLGLSVFEVEGGIQHDQTLHGALGVAGSSWVLGTPSEPGPSTLLPPGLTYVPPARATGARWFVQSLGDLTPTAQSAVTRPTTADWTAPSGTRPGVRLHLLGDTPMTAYPATSPDPSTTDENGGRRASLVLRRRAADGASLHTVFVTLFEPRTAALPPLRRVGRVRSPAGTVVVYVETAAGAEHLVINLAPGTLRTLNLADGRAVRTDGLALRVSDAGLVLAGGTFAEVGGRRVAQPVAAGRVVGVVRQASGASRGWFESSEALPDPETLRGRVMLIRHGDGTTRGWTVERVENDRRGARLHVREEPGFTLDPGTRRASYYQFPRLEVTGPHSFRVGRIARDTGRAAAGTTGPHARDSVPEKKLDRVP